MFNKIIRRMWKPLVLGLLVALVVTLSPVGLQFNNPPQDVSSPDLTLGQYQLVLTIGTDVYASGVADYTCDGVADDVQFQAALDALPAAGGKLVALTGDYVFAATVLRAIDDVTIDGMGDSTYFAFDDGTALFDAGAQNGWVFRNFRTDNGGVDVSGTEDYVITNITVGTVTVGKITRGATLVVAASDSSDSARSQADYVCAGDATDVTTINAASATLTSGGTIRFTAGIFNTPTSVLYRQGVSFIGSGDGGSGVSGVGFGTVFDASGNVTYAIDAAAIAPPGHIDGVTIRDIKIIEGTNGIRIINLQFSEFENISVKNPSANAIEIVSGTGSVSLISITNLTTEEVGGDAISIGVSDATRSVTAIIIQGGYIAQAATGNGILIGRDYGVGAGIGIASIIVRDVYLEAHDVGARVGDGIATSFVRFENVSFDGCATSDLVNGANATNTSVNGGLLHYDKMLLSVPLSSATPSPFLVVASSSQTYTRANLYASGTSDETPINLAATWLNSKFSGGTVQLTEGTYTVDGAITLADSITLQGASKDGTIITSKVGSVIDVIRPAGGSDYVTIKDLTVTGAAAAKNLIRIDGSYATVSNVISSGGDGTSQGIGVGSYGKIINCKVSGAGYNMMLGGDYCQILGGESSASVVGMGAWAQNDYGSIIGLYSHSTTTGSDSGIYVSGDYNLIEGNQVTANDHGIRLTSDANNNIVTGNDVLGNNINPVLNEGTAILIHSNMGYIAPGEVRTASGVLAAGNANAICFAWHNPELQDSYIAKVVVVVTTAGGTVGSHLDVGIADDAAGTNRGVEFFDDLLLNSVQVNDSWVAGDGGTQTKWVFIEDSASATDDWVVGQILDENAASLVGRYYIEYVGK